MPNGDIARIMEPAGSAPLRLSYTNSNYGPVNPFTGKPVGNKPPGMSSGDWEKYVRDETHIYLDP